MMDTSENDVALIITCHVGSEKRIVKNVVLRVTNNIAVCRTLAKVYLFLCFFSSHLVL